MTRLVIPYWLRKREYLLLVSEDDFCQLIRFIVFSEGSDDLAHPHNLERAFVNHIHKIWKKMKDQPRN